MKFVSIISNSRMLFLFLLITAKSDRESCLYIFDENIRGVNITPTFVSTRAKGLFDLFIKKLRSRVALSFFLLKRKIKLEETIVYGADHLSHSLLFLKKCSFFLIEDGTENYHQKSYKRSWKNKLFSIPKFGMYKNVKRIYLTKRENIPDCIKSKVEYISIKDLWFKKTEEEKLEILYLLGIDMKKIQLLIGEPFILFTQPLSEDYILTENEKIELYKSIIDKYDASKLVIKPHPREKTDYSRIFPNVKVFDETYPSEVLDILEVKFSRVITLFSTAAFSYPKEKVDFYGTKIHPKLLAKFGNIEYE